MFVSLLVKLSEKFLILFWELFWFPAVLRYIPTMRLTKHIIISTANKITINWRIFFDMSDFYNLKVNINKAQSTKRLDKALTNILGKFSRSHIKILIENGNVKKNNKIIDTITPLNALKKITSQIG